MARMTKQQVSDLDDLTFNAVTAINDFTSYQVTAREVVRHFRQTGIKVYTERQISDSLNRLVAKDILTREKRKRYDGVSLGATRAFGGVVACVRHFWEYKVVK